MKLTIKQTAALDLLENRGTTEVLFGGSAGGGKTALGCYWQLKRRLQYPGTRGLIGRSKLKTLKETTLKTFFEVAKMQGLIVGKHFKYNQLTNTIIFKNKSEILLKDLYQYPSDPNFDELGSLEITDAFIDEANQITEKARNIVKSRIRYGLKTWSIPPKMLMTCNPAKNWTYTDFYKPYIDGTLREDRAFIQAVATDNPYLSEYYVKNLQDLDNVSKQRLLYGNWDYNDDPTELIPHENIANMFIDILPAKGKRYITVDVARFGKDASVIMVWRGLTVIKIVKIKTNTIPKLVSVTSELMHTFNVHKTNVIADEGGVGGGFVDMLGSKGFISNAKAKNKENFFNLKSQCYYKLANLINEDKVKCLNTVHRDTIIEELSQIKTYKSDSDGKLQILPKDKIKQVIGRSPDFSDTMMMRMYFELGARGKYARPSKNNIVNLNSKHFWM